MLLHICASYTFLGKSKLELNLAAFTALFIATRLNFLHSYQWIGPTIDRKALGKDDEVQDDFLENVMKMASSVNGHNAD